MMNNSKSLLTPIMLLAVLVLQGCGHKGPLFLPKNSTPPAQSEQKK
jgi:predicted small lipoprotein YifL